jgi:hypothetical protein
VCACVCEGPFIQCEFSLACVCGLCSVCCSHFQVDTLIDFIVLERDE